MKEDNQFAKDVRIHFRTTNYRKQKIKARAKELGLDVSKYILKLISKDFEQKKKDTANEQQYPFSKSK